MSPLLSNFDLEYVIRKVQKTNLGLDINGIHQVLIYVDNFNLIGDNIRTTGRYADKFLNGWKDIGLTVSIGKTKYMEVGRWEMSPCKTWH
jgi:hypothetical protein